MAVRFLIDQDKEKCFQLNVLGLHPFPMGDIGYKLLMDMSATPDMRQYQLPEQCADLGLFDTLTEVRGEIENILTATDNVYCVGGYSNGGFASW